jgi:isopenicillin-N N-acyltransferase-like protein
MTSQPLRILTLTGNDPRSVGREHGEAFRESIYEIAEIRLERMCALPPYQKVGDILSLAAQHLSVLRKFDENLLAELEGIADASNVSLERIVVLNHYTDLRDIVPGSHNLDPSITGKEDNGGCSIIFSPTDHGPILGQTWDIHASAEPYVVLLRLHDMLVFSITGCLGMTGINRHGVGIAINNLSSLDARVGVLWPALIRKSLTHKTAVSAKGEIMDAHLGSGRHFAIADAHSFFSIETSATKKKVVFDKAELYFHTNHCLDEEMRKTHVVRQESTTFWRYQQLDEVIRHEDLSSAEKVFLALAKVSLPAIKSEPHTTATCGTFVMDINHGSVLACEGIATEELLQQPATRVSL